MRNITVYVVNKSNLITKLKRFYKGLRAFYWKHKDTIEKCLIYLVLGALGFSMLIATIIVAANSY